MIKYGLYNISTVVNPLKLANPMANAQEMLKQIQTSHTNSHVILFPELALTGYTCEDLFLKRALLDETQKALIWLCAHTQNIDSIIIFGLPLEHEGRLYNCAAVLHQGRVLGFVPKTHFPTYNEFYEKRWFTEGGKIHTHIDGVLLSRRQIFSWKDLRIGVEICEDVWSPYPPSTDLALAGANIIVNLSASPELTGKKSDRVKLVDAHSDRCLVGYVYCGSGTLESTKDIVFSGHCFAFEAGSFLGENKRFVSEDIKTFTLDVDKINLMRIKNKTFASSAVPCEIINHDILVPAKDKPMFRTIDASPFVPKDQLAERTEEIFNILVHGLKRRLFSIGSPKVVIGISGGLDSTLALLVAHQTCDAKNIYCYSMPGPGTSIATKNNAKTLAQLLGVNFLELDINEEVNLHLKNIDHNTIDVTYENVQARIRTLHLFNFANKHNAIVVGTGDMSEIALGWSTYNGDHMSNYNINAGVPKTLVKYLVEQVAKNRTDLTTLLQQILTTPISPELIPNNGNASPQETEKIIGPYEYHDFFIYHFLKNGFSKDKILYLAQIAFKQNCEHYFNIFWKRFRTQQFKRTVSAPGPKVGTVSLSPRGDWRMPDEAEYE